jgi:hypothetical protein
MKLFSFVLVAMVVAASALPVIKDLDLHDLLTDNANDISNHNLKASELEAGQALAKKTSKMMANIRLQQAAQESNAASAMQAAALAQKISEKKSLDKHVSPTGTTDLSLSVGEDYVRANPSINQYTFSSCYSNDAPNTGHCRPQIDSAQVSCC